MKNNKNGFAPIIAILLVVVAALAIGGGAYYAGSKKSNNVVEQPQVVQEGVQSQEVATTSALGLPILATTTTSKASVIPKATKVVKTSNPKIINTKEIKIKLSDGKVVSRQITSEEFDQYNSALSLLPTSENEKQRESLAFPSQGYKIIKNAFGDIKTYTKTQVIKFFPLSDVYIANVITLDKNNVVDFSSFPLELAIEYGKATTTQSYTISNLAIFYWAGDSVCSEGGCGYYLEIPSQIDTQNKEVDAKITKSGQYILGIKK